MKTLSNLASIDLARLGQTLQSLRTALQAWQPQRAPVLVPIPIHADHRDRRAARRLPHRGG